MSTQKAVDDKYAKNYWINMAETYYAKGHVFRAWLAATAAGINDPFGETKASSQQFTQDLRAGLRDAARVYTLSYDDPQSFLTVEYFDRTGSAEFNRAPPLGKFPGGRIATENLQRWIEEKPTIKLVELISKAIQENHGNVTLGMGSIAEILCRKRSLAVKISSLNCPNRKDYYRFAGAYVGFQRRNTINITGYAGSTMNILGNPFAYLFGRIYEAYEETKKGNKELAKDKLKQSIDRFEIDPNWDKIHEFNVGYTAAMTIMTNKTSNMPSVLKRSNDLRYLAAL